LSAVSQRARKNEITRNSPARRAITAILIATGTKIQVRGHGGGGAPVPLQPYTLNA
jgi:hypothetical protein